ncbi:MAG: hypothetical protein ACQEWM_05095 [Actinomycetota bacterium]
MRWAALLGAIAVAALGGCSPQLGSYAQPGATSSAEGRSAESAPTGPHLRVAGHGFDPVAEDVGGTEVCDGRDGRETLEAFDRAAWPELDVAAGDAVLRCGHADGAGWRHIADGHTGDFDELAALVGAGWEDVAWFAIDRALEQPTVVERYRDDIVNYDVLVEYVDVGQVERSWMVTVGVGLGSGQIITSFPDEQR